MKKLGNNLNSPIFVLIVAMSSISPAVVGMTNGISEFYKTCLVSFIFLILIIPSKKEFLSYIISKFQKFIFKILNFEIKIKIKIETIIKYFFIIIAVGLILYVIAILYRPFLFKCTKLISSKTTIAYTSVDSEDKLFGRKKGYLKNVSEPLRIYFKDPIKSFKSLVEIELESKTEKEFEFEIEWYSEQILEIQPKNIFPEDKNIFLERYEYDEHYKVIIDAPFLEEPKMLEFKTPVDE